MEAYPKRDAFFSHRFVRLLQKSCAAMDIGQNACLLLCYIAHTEDAARYSGPVRFWNEQLMTTMGFKSPKQLTDARKRAIDAGWLEYDRAGNRQVGRYFVKIPHGVEGLADSVVIEPNHSANLSENGMNGEPILSENGMNKERIAERIGNGSRNEYVTESGKHSIPIPSPIPDPTPNPNKRSKRAINYTDDFERFWKLYPRKLAKEAALKAWKTAIQKTDCETIISAAAEFAKSDAGNAGNYTPHPASWLNAGRWADDREAWKDKEKPLFKRQSNVQRSTKGTPIDGTE